MSATDPRSDDELRECIRTGDAPERVLAAFELGRRLGAEVTRDVALDGEPSSGVRRHWLTILASFGERDAVRSIAEHHAADAEGEHALHLAMQLGLTDPEWLALRFNDTTEHMQGVLLARDEDLVDWTRTVPTLRSLLNSAFPETRRNAARRLLAQQPVPGPALREYAAAAPSEGVDVVAAWARGPDHPLLLEHLPMFVDREDVALRELLAAGRRYPLGEIRSAVFENPQAFPLVAEPIDRASLFSLTDDLLKDHRSVSTSWLNAVARVLASPWTASERAQLDRWAAGAQQWWIDSADWNDHFVEEPVHTAVLEAVQYPSGPWKR